MKRKRTHLFDENEAHATACGEWCGVHEIRKQLKFVTCRKCRLLSRASELHKFERLKRKAEYAVWFVEQKDADKNKWWPLWSSEDYGPAHKMSQASTMCERLRAKGFKLHNKDCIFRVAKYVRVER